MLPECLRGHELSRALLPVFAGHEGQCRDGAGVAASSRTRIGVVRWATIQGGVCAAERECDERQQG
jgi:hypothetical protein